MSINANSTKTGLPQQELRDANTLLGAGVGVGLLGAAGALAGAVCPLCVVFTPVLLGSGAYKRFKAKRKAAGGPATEES
jgi:hypothetical protein